MNNNSVTIFGELTNNFIFNHETHGKKIYQAAVMVSRLSGNMDIIPVMVSEHLIQPDKDYAGSRVKITGHFRSHNMNVDGKHHLELYVFVNDFQIEEELPDGTKTNHIRLDGFLCKTPVFRNTPLGKQITELMLAVNRPDGRTDYIPCICWGKNAVASQKLQTGCRCQIRGRIQSREYEKKLDDGSAETRTAYEVSVYWLDAAAQDNTEKGE